MLKRSGRRAKASRLAANESQRYSVWDLVKATFISWWSDNAPRLGASLAFYALFSVAPLLVFAVMLVGLFYGPEAAQGRVAEQMQGIMGDEPAQALQSLIASFHRSGGSPWATALSTAALLFGASGVLTELQAALNQIWKVRPKPTAPWLQTIRNRALTYLMVFVIGALFVALLLLSSAVTASWELVGSELPFSGNLAHAINYLVTLMIETILLALVFKLLPDAEIAWKDVWIGAFVTAILFAIGNLLIGLYLGSSTVKTAYGAAGSLAVFLLWTYYSAQIVYLGAEFTQVYARRCGSKIIPQAGAEEISIA